MTEMLAYTTFRDTTLPSINDGLYPVEKAQPTLNELDRFIEEHAKVQGYQLIDEETHKVIFSRAFDDGFCMYCDGYINYGFAKDKMYFHQNKLSQSYQLTIFTRFQLMITNKRRR